MSRFLLWLLLLLFPVSAVAQQAIVVDLGNGNYVGVLISADGTVHPIAKLTIVKPAEPPPAPHHAKKVTYIYEKDQGGVIPGVGAALAKINAEHPEIIATEFEEDTKDGTGEVPAQYSKSLEAARKAGLPCLVVEHEDGTIKVVPKPTTEAQVLEALKP